MAEARVTQAAVYALVGGEAAARASQAAVLVLAPEAAAVRATQAGVMALIDGAAGVRATQAAVIVLCAGTPCLTRWAQCWRIERRDGEVFAFTTADEPVVFRGETYSPCEGLSAGAIETGAVLGQVGNGEIVGVISDDSISEDDLLAGLFDGARIEVWMVPDGWGG